MQIPWRWASPDVSHREGFVCDEYEDDDPDDVIPDGDDDDIDDDDYDDDDEIVHLGGGLVLPFPSPTTFMLLLASKT